MSKFRWVVGGATLCMSLGALAGSPAQASSQGPVQDRLESGQLSQPGRVIAWGGDADVAPPPPSDMQSGVVAVAAGSYGFALALKQEGRVVAWGSNSQNWVPIEAQSGIVAISAGKGYCASALTSVGRMIAWAPNGSMSGAWALRPLPAQAESGIAAISGCNMALTQEGQVLWWEGTELKTVPAEVSSGISAIATDTRGVSHNLALRNDGRVIAWSVVNGQTEIHDVPIEAQSGVTAISVGGGHYLALKATGEVVAWGKNLDGQATVPAEARAGVSAIAAGNGYSLAVTSSGRVVGWGFTTVPTDPGLERGVSAVAAGGYLAMAISAPVPPERPTGLVGTASDGVVELTWTAPSYDGGAPITRYQVTASPGGQTCSTTGALSCTITGLTNGTSYTFTVTATNSAGTSRPSEPSAQVTPTGTPGAVTNLKATPAKGSIRVDWSPPSNMGGANSVTYQYQVGKKAWKSTSATSITVKGKRGVRISVSVRAVNQAGSGPSVSVSGLPR